jgi:hypothetical protein
MAVLKAYFDDSGEEEDAQHKVCSVGGYVGTALEWASVEEAWRAVLVEFGVKSLHMKYFAHNLKEFEKFKTDETNRRKFLMSLISIIRDSTLVGVASILRLADLRRFNKERGLSVGSYSLNLYTNMAQIYQHWPDDIVEVVIDRVVKHGPKAELARQYAETDAYYPNCGDKIQLIPLQKGVSADDIPALQLADFVAWEARKDIDTKDGWFETVKSGDDTGAWMRSLLAWSQERNHGFPYNRRSISELLRAAPVDGVVWDYRGICSIDKARNGIWPNA